MKISPKSKLVMIGDSITDCGRHRPIAEAPLASLGDGYVNLVNALLGATYPAHAIRVVNMGIGGDTVRDLKARWKSDVLDLRPDWLSIMIGINDVWRHFDNNPMPAGQISLEDYEQTLDGLIGAAGPGLKGLILLTPYYLQPDLADPMRVMMDKYRAAVHRLATKYQATLVDTQTSFDLVLKDIDAGVLSTDRVHPNLTGHMILARAFLKEIGYTW